MGCGRSGIRHLRHAGFARTLRHHIDAVGNAMTECWSNVGELGHAVDGEGHDELALGQAQLAAVDVDVADRGVGEAAALGRFVIAGG